MAVGDWSFVATLPPMEREADVENNLVLPLLEALGYRREDTRAKYPVIFRQGRVGRPNEADYVVFADKPHGPLTSLLVVEAKHPDEELGDAAREQADSYAANLRAPFLLVTNGKRLELWQLQLSGPTERVFDCDVSDLAVRHGELEALVSKAAAIDHCSKLSWKKLLFDDLDVLPYVDVVLRRVAATGAGIMRQLTLSSSLTVPADWALEQVPGTIISAPSGMGKTILCSQLAAAQAERVLQGQSRALPVMAYLPDLVTSKKPLLAYAHERIAAHLRSLDPSAAFAERLRRDGAMIIVDGFDRIDPSEQAGFEAMVREVQQDFRKVNLIVASRPQTLPRLETFARAELASLTDSEQHEIAERAGVNRFEHHVSHAIRIACRNAYLLARVLDRLKRDTEGALDLPSVLREYIDHRLSVDRMPLARSILCRSALEMLALATKNHGIRGPDALQLLQDAGLPADILDDLEKLELVARRAGGAVEIAHEVLGDFVRAEVHSRLGDAELLRALDETSHSPGSAYPLFLAALVAEPARQASVLNNIAKRDLRSYLGATLHRAPVANPDASWVLAEILDGFTAPTVGWGEVRGLLWGQAVGVPMAAPTLGIVGKVTPELSADYSYVLEPGVREGKPSGGSLHFSNLRYTERPADAGREIGASDLKKALEKLVKTQRLVGGLTWRRERLRRRLGELGSQRRLDALSLKTLRQRIVPAAGHYILDGVPADEVLGDIDALLAAGEKSLKATALPSRDASPTGSTNWSAWFSDAALVKLVEEQYVRAMDAYKEVAEASFAGSAARLPHYQVLPVRYKIEIVRDRMWPVAYPEWAPVAAWAERGADVSVVNAPSASLSFDDIAKLRAQLQAFGRDPDVISIGGFSVLHRDFSDGSAITNLVCEWLSSDLARLFAP